MVTSISSNTIENAKKIYMKLMDDESRQIFKNKLLYSFTDDELYIYDILKDRFEEFGKRIKKIEPNVDIIVYGAGVNCKIALNMCKIYKKDVSIICDRDEIKQKMGYDGVKVISPEELINKYRDAYVVVSTTNYLDEVVKFLSQYYKKDKIIPLANNEQISWIKSQYFDQSIIKLEDGEIFVDGGCYDLETSEILISKCKPDKIYAFEPDKENFEKVERKISENNYDNIILSDKGLWNKSDNLHFNASGDILSYVSNEGEDTIEVVALDEVIDDRVTFIKMDIEGSELCALEGAKKIIQKYKPKLAICIYHKPEDTIDIPAYILEMVPEYKFWIRHYSYSAAETVLYAVV
mgnify:CR=1 FL=1